MSRLFRNRIWRTSGFFAALLILGAFNFLAFASPINLLDFYGSSEFDRTDLLDYTPEAWLSVLALGFGTLIIVISIAAESTPKLIDLFVEDFRSRLYIWFITLSAFENILLQLFKTRFTLFLDNLIFLNAYVQLPVVIVLAIPYIFYILKYTRNSNVINLIYRVNLRTIRKGKKIGESRTKIGQNHLDLMETINELHDLLQYVQFKEPKAEIISKMGKSLRYYLVRKKGFPGAYFLLGNEVKNDISFKTLIENFRQIEVERTFYEQKVLRVFGSSYLLLIQHGFYDLASMCGSEFYECGMTAINTGDESAVNAIIVHFNTLIRYGINHGLKSSEIRNVYNTIFHYSRLIDGFIQKRQEERIQQCCQYYTYYRSEVSKLSQTEPSFTLLAESFAVAQKRMLVSLYELNFPRELQSSILKIFNDSYIQRKKFKGYSRNSNERLIQIALSLFYMDKEELEFNEATVDHILKYLDNLPQPEAKALIESDCDRISKESEEFWEETDHGNRNIFYSPHISQLGRFRAYVFSKIDGELVRN